MRAQLAHEALGGTTASDLRLVLGLHLGALLEELGLRIAELLVGGERADALNSRRRQEVDRMREHRVGGGDSESDGSGEQPVGGSLRRVDLRLRRCRARRDLQRGDRGEDNSDESEASHFLAICVLFFRSFAAT